MTATDPTKAPSDGSSVYSWVYTDSEHESSGDEETEDSGNDSENDENEDQDSDGNSDNESGSDSDDDLVSNDSASSSETGAERAKSRWRKHIGVHGPAYTPARLNIRRFRGEPDLFAMEQTAFYRKTERGKVHTINISDIYTPDGSDVMFESHKRYAILSSDDDWSGPLLFLHTSYCDLSTFWPSALRRHLDRAGSCSVEDNWFCVHAILGAGSGARRDMAGLFTRLSGILEFCAGWAGGPDPYADPTWEATRPDPDNSLAHHTLGWGLLGDGKIHNADTYMRVGDWGAAADRYNPLAVPEEPNARADLDQHLLSGRSDLLCTSDLYLAGRMLLVHLLPGKTGLGSGRPRLLRYSPRSFAALQDRLPDDPWPVLQGDLCVHYIPPIKQGPVPPPNDLEYEIGSHPGGSLDVLNAIGSIAHKCHGPADPYPPNFNIATLPIIAAANARDLVVFPEKYPAIENSPFLSALVAGKVREFAWQDLYKYHSYTTRQPFLILVHSQHYTLAKGSSNLFVHAVDGGPVGTVKVRKLRKIGRELYGRGCETDPDGHFRPCIVDGLCVHPFGDAEYTEETAFNGSVKLPGIQDLDELMTLPCVAVTKDKSVDN
jgi:hypothetical protein